MATGENPFEAPRAPLTGAVGVRSGLRKDLRDVAVAQKGILICILLQIALFGSSFVAPPQLRTVAHVTILVVNVVATVFVFMLAIKVYNVLSLRRADRPARGQQQGDGHLAAERVQGGSARRRPERAPQK